MEFDHNKTAYPLRGMHEKVRCTQCHVKPVFTDVGKTCTDCHADIHRRKFGSDCAQCHTVRGWNATVQQVKDHQNRFPLFGAHAAVQCDECHKSAAVGQFRGLSTQCASCHLKDYQLTTNPNHASAKFPTACDTCHGFDTWLNAKFDHSTTGFLLTDGHANVPCASCHINNNYNLQIAPTDCGNSGCHLTTWQKTANPVHSSAGPVFAVANCSNCHTPKGWDSANFDHSFTGFPLTFGHANVPCASCHINNNYNLQVAPNACGTSGCHLTTWQQTNNPVHSTAGPAFALANCSNCHTTKGWDAASFDHSDTGFTLTGTHMSPTPTPCASCHINNNYTLNSADCMGCHQADWNRTPSIGGNVPDHIKAGFPTTASACATCHPITTWADGKFDHNAFGFPLTNGHANVPCASCHINNNYSLNIAATACGTSGCHLATWQQTNNPVHATAGPAFALANCSNCHTTKGWDAASFDHSVTGFTLTGTHMSPTPTPCASCHINNNYTLNSADCMGCHQSAWQSTTTLGGNVPNHVTAGFPATAAACASCHPITTWADGRFNHSTTGFTLVGTHFSPTPTPCSACHINGNYTLNSTDCMSCHTSAWQSTATLGGNVPNHITAGFPSTAAACSSCHPITTWADGKFDHSTTGFPLTNKHTTVQCSQCHLNGNYSLKIAPTDCGNSQCHLTTWQQTNNPVHSTAGPAFAPANCSTCHTTAGWDAASFDHSVTGFTLVGTHMSPTPTPCASCHVSNNYSLSSTDCMGCHSAAWNSTTTIGGTVPNHIAAGFPSTAAMCASCHPITTWSAGKFDHTTTGFTLTGAHVATPCSSCHVNNNYSGNLPTDCYGCHQAAWQSTVTLGGNVPNHIAAGFPTTCATCHNTTSWLNATFDHTQYWQLPHHGAVCTDCHIDNTNYANISCINCHTSPYHAKGQTDSQHQGISGYSYGPMTCIKAGCHTKGSGGG